MQWQSLDDFLHMGGHGLFVWGSYVLTFVLILLEALFARSRHRRAIAAAARAAREDRS